MKILPWERPARIAEVGDQIWSYVSPSSTLEGPGLLAAAALVGWAANDVVELAALQFLLSAEARNFVDDLPRIVRRLSTASIQQQERSAERIRGPVQWGPTITGRLANGGPNLHVTAPVDRAYQTAENELLVHVLDAVVRLGNASGWDKPSMKSAPAAIIRNHVIEATKWQGSSMLSTVRRLPPNPKSIARVAAGRAATRYGSVLSAYRMLDALVQRLDRVAIRAAIEKVGLVTASEPILFELLTLFKTIGALNVHGWELKPLRVFRGAISTCGIRADGRRLDLWYQPKPSELSLASKYRELLSAHRFQRVDDLRPDLVLRWQDSTGGQRILIIECKLSQTGGVREGARKALFDLLAYRHAFDDGLSQAGRPYGLGVSWGAGLVPQLDQDVMLCTPDTIEEALSVTAASDWVPQ